MASTDARPVPKKNVAYRVTFPILDADGDLVTAAAALDSEVSIDGGTFADCTNEATEIATSSGMYFLDLTSGEMNGDTIAVIVKTTTTGAKTTPIVLYPEEAGDIRVNVTQISDDTVAADNAEAFFDGTGYAGTGNTIPTVTTVNGLAANTITASAIASNAIDADALAADVTTELRAIVSGTADSGSTTTMVDAARTEADTDYWKGMIILFTSGTIIGQARLITAFDAATDTITFAPATTQAVGTNTYEILPAGRADLHLWKGSVANDLVSGRVDSSVGAMASDTITAAAIATGAIDADAIADNAIDAGAFAADAITAAKIANGAIDAATFAAGAIDAAALASDAVTEIRSLVSGTSDSGSTTTMVDAARTEADTDYWKGNFILFTSGTIIHQCRLITAFDAATDTITFAPATTQAVSTQTYEILPAARVDLQLWLGSVVNALVSGRVDASVGAMAANTVTAAAIATDAIDADALAADALAEIKTQVVNALTVDTYAEPSGVVAATATIKDMLNWLKALARNRVTMTSTTQTLRNDANSADISTSTQSDDGTTYVRGEWA